MTAKMNRIICKNLYLAAKTGLWQ